MKIKTIYIDDDDENLKKYKRKFGNDERSKNKFDIVTINVQKPLKNLLDEIEDKKPELILVDFKLDKPKDGILIGTTGIPLSTALRERLLDIPIVLFTRKTVFKIKDHVFKKGFLSNLDRIIYKSDLFKKETNDLEELYDLAIGFKKLRKTKPKKWNILFELIGAPEDEYELLKLSNRSMGSKKGKSEWSVPDAANWILEILIKYPGILYDPIHAATFLGISLKEFTSDTIQKFFDEAKYASIFAPPEGRWWRSKLHKIALSIMNEKDMNLSLQKGFPQAWEREQEEIERSKCIFSGESPADWVCYILNKPIKIKYSLSYRPDSRPEVMDEARVSFTAIRNSNEVDDELFYPLGRNMLPKIRNIPEEGKH